MLPLPLVPEVPLVLPLPEPLVVLPEPEVPVLPLAPEVPLPPWEPEVPLVLPELVPLVLPEPLPPWEPEPPWPGVAAVAKVKLNTEAAKSPFAIIDFTVLTCLFMIVAGCLVGNY